VINLRMILYLSYFKKIDFFKRERVKNARRDFNLRRILYLNFRKRINCVIIIRMIVELNKTRRECLNSTHWWDWIEWSSSWTKFDVSASTQFIDGVEHPTLSNELSWVDEFVRRSNPTHSRDAHPLFEKKENVK
jgi:hypothetical protein